MFLPMEIVMENVKSQLTDRYSIIYFLEPTVDSIKAEGRYQPTYYDAWVPKIMKCVRKKIEKCA